VYLDYSQLVSVEEILKSQPTKGPTTVMAIGTATPPNCIDQSTYPNYYFRITNGVDMLGADYRLTKLLGLRPSVKRYMM